MAPCCQVRNTRPSGTLVLLIHCFLPHLAIYGACLFIIAQNSLKDKVGIRRQTEIKRKTIGRAHGKSGKGIHTEVPTALRKT